MNLVLPLIWAYAFLEEVGRIRAAAYLAQTGDIEAALKVMQAK